MSTDLSALTAYHSATQGEARCPEQWHENDVADAAMTQGEARLVGNKQGQAAMFALMRANSRAAQTKRKGFSHRAPLSGAPSHAAAELLTALEQEGYSVFPIDGLHEDGASEPFGEARESG